MAAKKKGSRAKSAAGSCKKLEFWGYPRENGRVGVRNHVVTLPLDDLSNAAGEAVANNIEGTLALPTTSAACSSARTWNCTSAASSARARAPTSPRSR